MPRELLILRHGKSEKNPDVDDYHRHLDSHGKRAAQRIGVWLAQQALLPDLVISSPALRALGTAQKCCKVMGLDARQIQRKKPLYLASLSVLKAQLAACPPESQRVMLVGHNPGLERLLSYLCAKTKDLPNKGQLLPTAALARLAMPDDWSDIPRGAASLLRLQRAAKLPRRFPFPGPDGSERRDRPAYYYTQSAVIPYRIRDGRLEILLVRSSGDKHWVAPKGIIDPGHSPQEAALKEAWEEAGIEGEVDNEPLGSYRYTKWGAHCSVAVYPMTVKREIPMDEWEEPERGRHWVSAEMASKMLKHKGLRPLVEILAQRLGIVS
jgi:phosphohistidine phosphatase